MGFTRKVFCDITITHSSGKKRKYTRCSSLQEKEGSITFHQKGNRQTVDMKDKVLSKVESR